MRNPLVGFVASHKQRRVTIAPPMAAHERVVIAGPASQLEILYPDPATVLIRNRTERTIAFVLLVVHKNLAALTRVPWGRVLEEAQKPGGLERVMGALLRAAHQRLLHNQSGNESPDRSRE